MKDAGLIGLNAVVAVAAHRSFRRAAAELGLSPSGLSHTIAAVEKRMGLRLFNRTTRSVALSEAGEAFLKRVQPALKEISHAMEDVNSYRDTPRGTLRINLSEGAAEQMLQPIILPFLRRYPDMKLDLVTEPRLIDIVAEGFDAGVRLAEAVPQDMIAIPCGPNQRFVVVGSPDYFSARPLPRAPADLSGHACIRRRFSSGSVYRWEFEKHGEEIAIEVDGPLTVGSDRLMMEAALAGQGLAYVSAISAAEALDAGRLLPALEDWTPPFPGLRFYYPGRRHLPAGLRALIGMVREAQISDGKGPATPPASP